MAPPDKGGTDDVSETYAEDTVSSTRDAGER